MDEVLFRIRRFIGWFFGVVGIVAAYLSGWDIISHFWAGQSNLSFLANIYIFVITGIVIIFCSFRVYQTIKKEKYANITPLLHQSMHAIKELQTYLLEEMPREDAEDQAINNYLKLAKGKVVQCLDNVADIFRVTTSTHCRSCIKMMYPLEGNGDQIFVYTYARDGAASSRCLDTDRRRIRENHDPLLENYRFAELFDPNRHKWYYFCNNLAKDSEFRTTSVTAYQPDTKLKVGHGLFHSSFSRWPLPYRSTITCVIRQGQFDLLDNRQSEVIGFICVDSESRGVFEERWDVNLLFSIADALYHPLKLINEQEQRLSQR